MRAASALDIARVFAMVAVFSEGRIQAQEEAQRVDGTPTVRLCETPNARLADAVRFEFATRGMVLARCDEPADMTLRIVYQSDLAGGFVEVRGAERILHTRVPGPLDSIDDRVAAVTAAALVEEATSTHLAQSLPPVPPVEESRAAESDSQAEEDLEQEPEAEPEPPAVVRSASYLDTRHFFDVLIGGGLVGVHPVLFGGLRYGALPSPRVSIGIQLAVAAWTEKAEVSVDLRLARLWHVGDWVPELGGAVVAALRVESLFYGGVGGTLFGGATYYRWRRVGVHLGASFTVMYATSLEGRLEDPVRDAPDRSALSGAIYAGLRFGP